MATLRLVCAPPSINLVAAHHSRTFPSLLRYRAPDSHRDLHTRLHPNSIPLSWMTDRPKSQVSSHLPMDEPANIAPPLLGNLFFAPLSTASLLPKDTSLPSHDTMIAAFQALRGRTRSLLVSQLALLVSPPIYYTFPLSPTTHPFLELGNFIASRIHQMTGQNSYLTTHSSWSRMDNLKYCPFTATRKKSSIILSFATNLLPFTGSASSMASLLWVQITPSGLTGTFYSYWLRSFNLRQQITPPTCTRLSTSPLPQSFSPPRPSLTWHIFLLPPAMFNFFLVMSCRIFLLVVGGC